MKTFLTHRALALSSSALPALALALPLGLGGMGTGQAVAQVVFSQEYSCGDTTSGVLDRLHPGYNQARLVAGARCTFFNEQRTPQERAAVFRDSVTCPAGDAANCARNAATLITEFNATKYVIVESTQGATVFRGLQPDGVGGNATALGTETISRTETVSVVANITRTDRFETRVTGRLGGASPLYDQRFDKPFTDVAVQAGVNTATLAVTATGGPGVMVLAPTLVTRQQTLDSRDVSTVRDVVGTPVQTFSASQFTGPAIYPIGATTAPGAGDFGLCETGGQTNELPSGCEKVSHVIALPFGSGATHFNLNTHSDILETVTGTEIWLIFEHWDIVGIVQAIGTVNASVRSGGYDMNARFLRRLMTQGAARQPASLGGVPLAYAREPEKTEAAGAVDRLATGAIGDPAGSDGAGWRYHGWLEGYASTASAAAQGAVPGDRRTAWGLSGGAAYAFANGLTLGFGVDRGRTDVSLSAVGESGDIELTQFGLSARFNAGRWFAGGALSYGLGEVDTTQTLGGVSTAAYDLKVFGLVAETGYRVDLGGVMLTPSAGLDFTHLRTSAFTGAGGAALSAPAFTSERTRAFAGLEIAKGFDTGGGRFELSGSARIVGVLSGEERLLPVVLAAAPGAPLTVTGASEGRIGLDLGAESRYRFAAGAEIFARYDGEFRKDFDAHQGTVGLRISW